MQCSKQFSISVLGAACVAFDELVWEVPVYDTSGGAADGFWTGPNFGFSLGVVSGDVSATNSATVPINSGPIIVSVDVTWTAGSGSGGLGFNLDIGTTNFGNLFHVDGTTNFPAWNTTQHYEFTIPETTLDTIEVGLTGFQSQPVPNTASIEVAVTCSTAFGNVEQNAHVACGVGCIGPGGDGTVAENTFFATTQEAANALALAQATSDAQSEADNNTAACCCPGAWEFSNDCGPCATTAQSSVGTYDCTFSWSGSDLCSCTVGGELGPVCAPEGSTVTIAMDIVSPGTGSFEVDGTVRSGDQFDSLVLDQDGGTTHCEASFTVDASCSTTIGWFCLCIAGLPGSINLTGTITVSISPP